MAFIGESRKDSSSAWGEYLCLHHEECKVLLPLAQKRLKEAVNRLEYYEGLHEAGTSNDRQEDLLSKWEEEVEYLSNIINKINFYLLK